MQEVADVQELRLQQPEDIATSLFEGQYKFGRAVTDQSKHLTAIVSRLDRIDNRMDSLETRMDSLDSRMDGLDMRMDRLETQIADLTKLVSHALDVLAFIRNYLSTRE